MQYTRDFVPGKHASRGRTLKTAAEWARDEGEVPLRFSVIRGETKAHSTTIHPTDRLCMCAGLFIERQDCMDPILKRRAWREANGDAKPSPGPNKKKAKSGKTRTAKKPKGGQKACARLLSISPVPVRTMRSLRRWPCGRNRRSKRGPQRPLLTQ